MRSSYRRNSLQDNLDAEVAMYADARLMQQVMRAAEEFAKRKLEQQNLRVAADILAGFYYASKSESKVL